jgi:hypothetical protein
MCSLVDFSENFSCTCSEKELEKWSKEFDILFPSNTCPLTKPDFYCHFSKKHLTLVRFIYLMFFLYLEFVSCTAGKFSAKSKLQILRIYVAEH